MKAWLHKIEVIVDKLVPYMLVLLLFIIVLELGFHDIAEHYHLYIEIGDGMVIGIFSIDLIFKYIRIRKLSTFLKKCWPDIIAVFPFFLMFRALEGIIGLFSRTFGEGVSTAQSVIHEGLATEREAAKVIEGIEKEGARAGKISRTQKMYRFIRPILRSTRFLKVLPFFERPTGDHHLHESKKKLKK